MVQKCKYIYAASCKRQRSNINNNNVQTQKNHLLKSTHLIINLTCNNEYLYETLTMKTLTMINDEKLYKIQNKV